MRKARIVVRDRRGHHSGGGSETASMELRAGRRGMGQKLAICHYWPWSWRSAEEAENYLFAAAERLGYEIV